MNSEILSAIISGDSGISITLSAADLRQVVNGMVHAERQRTKEAIAKNRELPIVSRKEAAEQLNVSYYTLWQWAKSGYLTPIKIGCKVFYRPSDIDEILHRKQKDQ